MASSFAPRQEAVPFGWQKLSTDQQDIVRDVHRWLAGFMSKDSASGDSDGKKDNADFLPRIEFERKSNVLLIDGGRGTGKTSVFLTLLQIWRDALGLASARLSAIEDAEIAEVVQQRRIIPLDILDMQPLSGHPTLLLQLAGRLYRVAARLAKNAGEQEPEYPQRAGDAFPPSLQKWRELARVVAIAQEDDPHLRRSQNNPEDFAIELESAERQRAYLGARWHNFVDTLRGDVKNYADRLRPLSPGTDPIFIVPIDDADMNPERGVELLELLRSLWHPRVVFLLTGDAGLFRTLLFNHYKRICKWMPGIMARNLAHDVLGKVIPPAQRLRCRVMPKDSLKYLTNASGLPKSFAERITSESLQAALPRRWRVLRDLVQSLNGKRLTSLQAARVIFEEAVRGSALGNEDQEHLLSSCFKPARHGDGLRVDESAVVLQPATDHRESVRFDKQRAVLWNVSDEDRWSLALRANAASRSEAVTLPDSVIQSLYLAASLASEPPVNNVEVNKRVGRSLSPATYVLISSTFSFEPIKYEFPWPAPKWQDPLDFLLFLRGWRAAIDTVRGDLAPIPGATRVAPSQAAAFESLAFWWTSAICDLAKDGSVPEANRIPPQSQDWRTLGTRVAHLAQQSTPWRHNANQFQCYLIWAQRDALFFSDKLSGLNREIRNSVLEGWLLGARPLISKFKKDEEHYWLLVNMALLGNIGFVEDAARNDPDNSIGTQLDVAIRSIRNGRWNPKPGTDNNLSRELLLKEFRRQLNDKNDELSDLQCLVLALRALDPEAVDPPGYESNDLRSVLFDVRLGSADHGIRRSQAHYKSHLRFILSNILIDQMPPSMTPDTQRSICSLWSRAQNTLLASWDVTSQLAELAEATNLLEMLQSQTGALKAWPEMVVMFFVNRNVTELDARSIIDRFLTRTISSPLSIVCPKPDDVKKHDLPGNLYAIAELGATTKAEEIIEIEMGNREDSILAGELLAKLHDIVVDHDDVLVRSAEQILPLMSEFVAVEFSGHSFKIPVPAFPNTVDFLLFLSQIGSSVSWLTATTPSPVRENPTASFIVFSGFIVSSCVSILETRQRSDMSRFFNMITGNGTRSMDEMFDELSRFLCAFVLKINGARYQGRRALAVREWVNLAGPLFAAPETGMSSARAAHWLRAWDRSPSNTDDPAACKRLSAFRLKRAQLSLGAETTLEKAQEFLDGIDAKHPDHPWVRRIEALAKGTQSA